jgi:hypothetical protein
VIELTIEAPIRDENSFGFKTNVFTNSGVNEKHFLFLSSVLPEAMN